MGKTDIIAEIARAGLVEELVRNITGHGVIDYDLKDLVQIVYLALLETTDERVADLWESGQMRFYIARIIRTQLTSPRSTFTANNVRFLMRTVPIDGREVANEQ